MATIQEQLENAVAIYNNCANKVYKFINGSATETIESDTGAKPTIAKIIKDTQDSIDLVKAGINQKAEEVQNNKNDVINLKDKVVQIHQHSEIPLGAIMAFPKENLPQGFLECDGSVVQASLYPQLVAYLTSDSTATKAVLPDLRGVALRGWDNNRGLDNGRSLLSYQDDAMQKITGTVRGGDNDSNYATGAFQYERTLHPSIAGGGSAQICEYSFDSARVTKTAEETRMKNIAVVYAIKAFGAIVNVGDIDLLGINQEVQKLKTSKVITEDTNLFDNYCKYSWLGKISSNGGELLESANALTAYGVWSYGNPTFDKVNKVWHCPTYQDVIGIAYKKADFNTEYNSLEFTMRCKFTQFGTTRSQVFGFGLPNVDDIAPLLRVETSTQKFRCFMSTNDTDWNVLKEADGQTVIPLETLVDVRWTHDRANTGDLKIELSLDGLEYNDSNKIWTTEITGNTTAKLHLLPDSTNAIIVGFGTDQYEYQETDLPPQEVHADYCSFKLDGVELAKQHLLSGFNFKQSEEFHQIVGYKDDELISEFCYNADGSDALSINGDLAVVFSGRTQSNALTYDLINYYDLGQERIYRTMPYYVAVQSNSTTYSAFDVIHGAPANSHRVVMVATIFGGYINVANKSNGLISGEHLGALLQNAAQSGQRDIDMTIIPNIHKLSTFPVEKNSYDGNIDYLYCAGYSLKRGVKQ